MKLLQRSGLFLVCALLVFAPRRAHAEPNRITVGIYVNQVSSLDLKANTFTVDFWIWFRSGAKSASTRRAPDVDFTAGFYSGSSSLGVTIGTTGSSSSAPVSASTTKRNGVWSFMTSTAYASV